MKTRVLSAIIMILIAIPLVINGGQLFSLFALLLALFCLNEILSLRSTKKKIPTLVKGLAFIALIILVTGQFSKDVFVYAIDYKLIALTIFTLVMPIIIYHNDDKYNINDSLFIIGILFFLGTAFSLVVLIRDYSMMYLIYLIIISTVTDTYAYLIGSLIGKNKLIEAISPNKTIEGTIAGIVFGTVFGSMFYYMIINNTVDIKLIVFVTLLLSIVSQLGDLCFSAIKRTYKKKDFSNLIPGHGGIVDRLDSIIFIVLIFSVFINII